MLIILCLLVVAGVVLAVASIIFPISTDANSSTKQSFEEAESGIATTQLKSQIASLETEVKQMCVNYTAIRTDFNKLRNKESRLIDHLLNQKNLHDAQNEIYQLTSNNLILQDKVNRLLHFEEENKDLLLKNSKLSSEIERLQSESQNRDNEIILLRQKCDYMQTNLNDVNGRLDEIIKGTFYSSHFIMDYLI